MAVTAPPTAAAAPAKASIAESTITHDAAHPGLNPSRLRSSCCRRPVLVVSAAVASAVSIMTPKVSGPPPGSRSARPASEAPQADTECEQQKGADRDQGQVEPREGKTAGRGLHRRRRDGRLAALDSRVLSLRTCLLLDRGLETATSGGRVALEDGILQRALKIGRRVRAVQMSVVRVVAVNLLRRRRRSHRDDD